MLSVDRINKLEQENARLKKENKVNLSRSLGLNREIQNLSVENAELKAYKDVNEDFKTAWEELKAENVKLKEEITELEEKFLTLNGKSYSYYTTLQEIKDIVSKIIDSYIRPYGDYNQLKKILDLITKAEIENV